MAITDFSLEVKPRIPEALNRLPELANNLLFGWQSAIRALFFTLDRELWAACRHNPKVMLRRIDQAKLDAAAQDAAYLQEYHRQLVWFDNYCQPPVSSCEQSPSGLIAYFCAEYGFHESFPIYSGGLGILAADHCKAASDMGVPLVAVGLLYRHNHSRQIINAEGRQLATSEEDSIENLPVEPALDLQGRELSVVITITDREVHLKIWRVKAGRVNLYLLDSDLPDNAFGDRGITAQLYGGGENMRIMQEMVLGIGGVRALRALGLTPEVWHINEGHAAFLIIERILELIREDVAFDAALERVASATVFTLHTPIAAGHDVFDNETVVRLFSQSLQGVDVGFETLLALGETPRRPHQFSMTSLGLRGSRFYNGVSRIHGDVASVMEQHIWPQIPARENPMGYITNGIHIDSFLDREWQEQLHACRPDKYPTVNDCKIVLNKIDDATWWRIHTNLKCTLLDIVYRRLCYQHRRNGLSEALIERSVKYLAGKPADILVIGFARRFVAYKRATLLLSDRERLAALLNNVHRPVLILYAGRAHADDESGKALIREIYQLSLQPEFIGRIIMLEGYDMALARRMVSGCDVWLNTPKYPMEACGTSGQKAALNGVVNLSVKDGWWAEGYNGDNGWAVTPHKDIDDAEYGDRQEAMDILDILQHQVISGYFERGEKPYPSLWIRYSKASMSTILSHFSARRMLNDYLQNAYVPAAKQCRQLEQNHNATTLASWKKHIAERWHGVAMEVIGVPASEIFFGEAMKINVRVTLNGLSPQDLAVDCLFGQGTGESFVADRCLRLQLDASATTAAPATAFFTLCWPPEFCGLKRYRLRVYPWHPHLSHPFEMGRMLWLDA